MTRNPLKWHPRKCPELEIYGKRYSLVQDEAKHPTRQVIDDKWQKVGIIPTWSGDWQRRFLLAEGFTEEEITAATCLARMMGETI